MRLQSAVWTQNLKKKGTENRTLSNSCPLGEAGAEGGGHFNLDLSITEKLEMMDFIACGSLRLLYNSLCMSPFCHTLLKTFSMLRNIVILIVIPVDVFRNRESENIVCSGSAFPEAGLMYF